MLFFILIQAVKENDKEKNKVVHKVKADVADDESSKTSGLLIGEAANFHKAGESKVLPVICMAVCVPACLFACVPVCLYVCCLSVCLFVCLFVFFHLFVSVCLSGCPSVHLCLFVCLFVCLSVCLSFHLFVSVCLSGCLSVCKESFISYNHTIIHHSRNYSTKAKCFIVFIGKCIHIF